MRAKTIISSGCVEAIRPVTADLTTLRALVDVRARSIGLCAVSLGTGTIAQSSRDGNAFGPLRALSPVVAPGQDALSAHELIRWLALALQAAALFAGDIGVSIESGRAVAFITARQVLAERIPATGLLAILRALVHVAALLRGLIADKSLPTNAHVRPEVGILDTGLSGWTGLVVAAGNVHNVILGASIAIRIAGTAAGTLAGVAARAVCTNGATGTRIAHTLVNIHASGSVLSRGSGESFSAQALRHIVDDHALGVRRAGHCLAGMPAIVAHVWFGTQTALVFVADGISRTIGVRFASDHGDATNPGIRIRDRSLGARAVEGSREVVANGSFAAGVRLSALVQVDAETLCISSESGWTLAGVAAGHVLADRIVAALPRRSVDRIAFVNVDAARRNIAGIECPALFADAIGFHAIRLAVRMGPAFNILAGRLAFHSGRRSYISSETVALV